MVNTDDFIKRLEIILDYYSLNASTFADKIGVQRSSMSHLLSGRNKPSLDFIMKIIDFFPDVDLYWVLNGKGTFPKKSDEVENSRSNPSATFIEKILEKPSPILDIFSPIEEPQIAPTEPLKKEQIIASVANENSDEIEKIVLFYKNGTFKIYSTNML